MPQFVKAQQAARYYDISISNLRKWAREGRIATQKTPGGRYLYVIPDAQDESEHVPSDGWTPNIIYARVSSRKQQDDLERQALQLQQLYPNYTLVKDIGSGINYQRKGFQAILERLFTGDIKHVMVAHQDRFTRFGYDFFQWMFERFGARLESVERHNASRGEDLVDDIMEVFTVFTARYYGRRKYKNDNKKDEVLSDNESETAVS